jgi:putative radical SAM enzyme (TIGR03279 family)
MSTKITKVFPGSIAEELEIQPGDVLLSINSTPVKDIIDYRFLIADEYIEVEIEKEDGEIWVLEVEKDYEEDLGVDFESSIMDKARSCCNKCIFCFIDQLPKGMRNSLYFKDDDSRLSFLQGNFVTMTNMSDDDINRIIKYRISPINVSVHTTDPELRVKMLNNKNAGKIYERLQRLSEVGIVMNCQIVACPGINNGEELLKSVEDLYKLYPSIQNVAVVPVGITRFREGLHNMKLYDKTLAAQEIDSVKALQDKYCKEIGQPFVRLSDEFYVQGDIDIPEADFYGDYEQFEDGIGMIRLFRDNIDKTIENLKTNTIGSFNLITGVSAYKEIYNAAEIIKKKNPKLKLTVNKIINNYFGETITVAGLITGIDIINSLKAEELSEYIIIPQNMLKNGEEVFLDDVTLEELRRKLNRKVVVCSADGEDLIKHINTNSKEE